MSKADSCQLLDDTELCPICIENPTEYYTECNHGYCITCLARIKQCALCRKKLIRSKLCVEIVTNKKHKITFSEFSYNNFNEPGRNHFSRDNIRYRIDNNRRGIDNNRRRIDSNINENNSNVHSYGSLDGNNTHLFGLNSTDIQPSRNVNVYSFALNPADHQPSGTMNFSRIDNAVLQLR